MIALPKIHYRQELNLHHLNDIFYPLSFEERIKKLYEFFKEDEILFTSSFGTKSVLLIHYIQKNHPTQKVHFIDTTYHFQETLDYKNELAHLFNLDVVNVWPNFKKTKKSRSEQWWIDRPDECCSTNKVQPLIPIKENHKVWISGLMAYQTSFRSNLKIFEKQDHIIKFQPLIDIKEEDFYYQLSYNNLPRHPLESQGYGSLGCKYCTAKGKGRKGRWLGSGKTECGLHPTHFAKKMEP